MTKQQRRKREEKMDRFEKLILRLRHIEYSDDPESVYQAHEKEYKQLREELISCD